MKKSINKSFLKSISIFLIFELFIQTFGSLLARLLYTSSLYGKYASLFISEFTVLVLSILLVFILKKQDIFKNKTKSFTDTLKLCLPVVIISCLAFIGNVIDLFSSDIDIYNLVSMIFYGIAIGMFEELFFRGIIETELLNGSDGNKKSTILAIFLSALIFGLVHLINLLVGQDLATTIMQVIQTTAIGFLFGTTYYLTRNIYGMMFLHSFYDIALLLGDINYIKDCHYMDNLPTSVTIYTILISIILSTIYIVYSLGLLNRNRFNDEEINEHKIKTTTYITITVLILIYLGIVSFTNLFIFDLNDYYVCYEFKEKTFDKIETHYYNYSEFYIDNYYIYIKDDNAYIKDLNTNIETKLLNNVSNIYVLNKEILLVQDNTTEYMLYYSDYLNNHYNIDELKDSFITIDTPDIISGGYLYDYDNDKYYLMIKSDTQDLFIIDDKQLFKVEY